MDSKFTVSQSKLRIWSPIWSSAAAVTMTLRKPWSWNPAEPLRLDGASSRLMIAGALLISSRACGDASDWREQPCLDSGCVSPIMRRRPGGFSLKLCMTTTAPEPTARTRWPTTWPPSTGTVWPASAEWQQLLSVRPLCPGLDGHGETLTTECLYLDIQWIIRQWCSSIRFIWAFWLPWRWFRNSKLWALIILYDHLVSNMYMWTRTNI